MAAESKTSVAAYFTNFNRPSAASFGTLIDSYTDASDILEGIATAARTGSKGFVYVSGASATTFHSAAAQGLRLLNTATSAAAVQVLGAGAVGSAMFTATTTAAAQQGIGGGTVGRQLFETTTTGAATDIVGVTAATQTEAEAASASAVFMSPENFRHHVLAPKAWAWVSAGSTPEVKRGYNVASAVKKATGQYSVTFTLPFSDTNYAPIAMAQYNTQVCLSHISSAGSNTAAGCAFRFIDTAGSDRDPPAFSCFVFGDH